MADLSEIKSIERTLDIAHPGTGAPIGVKVSVVAITDERMKRLKTSIEDRRLKLGAKGKTFTSEEIDENRSRIAFTAMTGWTWEPEDTYENVDGVMTLTRTKPTFHNEMPEFNQRLVFAVFSEYPWFRTQIEEEISETERFFTK